MELKPERDTIDVCKTIFSCSAKQTIDTEFTLPDYCGDIKRILHCHVKPQLRAVSAADERATAQGDITVRLLYLNEQDKPDCLEQSLPLNVSCRCKETLSGAVLRADAATEYLNCRAVNARKVQLDGAVSVQFEAYAKQPVVYVKSMEGCEVQAKELFCSSMSAAAQKTFDLSETLALDEADPGVTNILHVSGTPLIESTETAENKLLVKGELRLEIACLSEDQQIRSVSHKMPISQVIEASGLLENDMADVFMTVHALYVSVKRSADAATRLIDIAAKVSAEVTAYRDASLRIITDCYAVQGSLTPTYQDCRLIRMVPNRSTQQNRHMQMDTGVHDGKLLFTAITGVQTNALQQAGACKLRHQVTLEALIRDVEGSLQYLSRAAEAEETVSVPDDDAKAGMNLRTTAVLDSAHLASDGTLEADVSFFVNGVVFSGNSERILTDVEMHESDEERNRSQIILSFCSGGEELWSICKRYRAEVATVKAENGLEEDTVPEKSVLLITTGA